MVNSSQLIVNSKEGTIVTLNQRFLSLVSEHYRFVAEKYDYLTKELNEGIIPVLMKTLDLKPGHVGADIVVKQASSQRNYLNCQG